ncbi:MAG: hypothetical protein IT270_08390 [Saprospiraceae bacterium]|nr:hypothetical protein [Saprospiraceae bacterium]
MPAYSRSQMLDFTVLALRWYLAFFMFSYGYSKMTGGQFGLFDPAMLDKPLRENDTFHLAWYLFSQSKSFDVVVGLSQILGAVLLVFNRTVLLGALVLLPVLGQILLVDVAFTMEQFGAALPVRLACMIISDMIILFYYREKVLVAFRALTEGITTRFTYPWWTYLLLPIIGLGLDLVWAVVTMPVKMGINAMLE